MRVVHCGAVRQRQLAINYWYQTNLNVAAKRVIIPNFCCLNSTMTRCAVLYEEMYLYNYRMLYGTDVVHIQLHNKILFHGLMYYVWEIVISFILHCEIKFYLPVNKVLFTGK